MADQSAISPFLGGWMCIVIYMVISENKYTYISMRTYLCLYVNISMSIYEVYIYMSLSIYACALSYLSSFLKTRTSTHLCVHIHVCKWTYLCLHMKLCTSKYLCLYMYVMSIWDVYMRCISGAHIRSERICVYIWSYVRLNISVCICMCIFICLYLKVCASPYLCVHIYICI